MKRKFILLLPLFAMGSNLFAQVNTDSVDVTDHDGMSAFTFSESQLDDDQDASQSATSLTSYNEDPYMSNVGYLFSPMRFRVRGYDSQYNGVYFNGARMNDVETGRFSYGLIGGLNDATRTHPLSYNSWLRVVPRQRERQKMPKRKVPISISSEFSFKRNSPLCELPLKVHRGENRY